MFSIFSMCSVFLIAFGALFLAAKCSTINHLRSNSNRISLKPLPILPFTQQILRQPIPENLWLYPTFFAICSIWALFYVTIKSLDTKQWTKNLWAIVKRLFLLYFSHNIPRDCSYYIFIFMCLYQLLEIVYRIEKEY